VPVTGSVDAPVIGGSGPVLEYAVKMRGYRGELIAADIISSRWRNRSLPMARLARLTNPFRAAEFPLARFWARSGARKSFGGEARCSPTRFLRRGGRLRAALPHLNNIARIDGGSSSSTALSSTARCVDVMSEVAFTVWTCRTAVARSCAPL
jgi:hypothetical protein